MADGKSKEKQFSDRDLLIFSGRDNISMPKPLIFNIGPYVVSDKLTTILTPNHSAQRQEVMYTFRDLKGEGLNEVNKLLPDTVKARINDRTSRSLPAIPIDDFLIADIQPDILKQLQEQYEVVVRPIRLEIHQRNRKGAISMNLRNGQIVSFVSGLGPSVVSVQFDNLRENSPFIEALFQRIDIPEKTEETISQAQRVIDVDIEERKRLSKIQPEKTGICEDLPREDIDESRTTVVGQKGYAFGHPNIHGSSILEIYGTGPCVGLFARNPKTGLCFTTHLDRSKSVIDAIQLIKREIGEEDAELVIYGGHGEAGESKGIDNSRRILADIEEERGSMKVIGKETLGNKDRSLALDTITGRYFIPIKPKIEDAHKAQLIGFRVTLDQSGALSNDGIPLNELYAAIGK